MDSTSKDEREFEDEGIELIIDSLIIIIIIIIIVSDVHSLSWVNHNKHIFIVSTSGKPIYSRYGKEEQLVNLFGIMQALVSFVADDKDVLR